MWFIYSKWSYKLGYKLAYNKELIYEQKNN